MAWHSDEFQEKVARVRGLMSNEGLEGVLVTSQTNFLWLTGGRPYINTVGDKACADILIMPDAIYLLANNIEADRLMNEELAGLPIETVRYDWWDSNGFATKLTEVSGGKALALDSALGIKFAKLRWNLTPVELARFKETCRDVGSVLESVAWQIRPGDSEIEMANMIKVEAIRHRVEANVALVAVDDRTLQYRHPVPTEKRMEKYAMLVISGQKHGLYASASRLVHFGTPSSELRRKHRAVLAVDAALIASTVPGTLLKDVFATGMAAYKEVGFEGEWVNHHQGGLAGYGSREIKADMHTVDSVKNGQVFAWNPTIAGVKSEDTILVADHTPQILTSSSNFPTVEICYKNIVLKRPDILVR